MSDSVEKLSFKIGLSGTYHDKKPSYTILINDTKIESQVISAESGEIFYVEFISELIENTKNNLTIRLDNKTNSDTVTDNNEIIKDMLLNIHSIEIDDIDLGSLVWTASTYKLDHPQKFKGEIVTELKNCVNLGFNGSYNLHISSPFYIWLLENI